MDRVQEMAVFRRVVEAGSLTRAAHSLGMGQPNVSRLINALEARLGVALLHRSTRGLQATEAGQTFYEEAGRALAALEEAEESVRGAQAEVRGTLRVAAPPLFFRGQVMHWLPGFLRDHPALSLELLPGEHALDMVAEGVDVALRVGPVQDGSLVARLLGRFAVGLYASPAYLGRHGTPEAPEDLAGHLFCLRRSVNEASLTLEDGAGRRVTVPRHGRIRADDTEVLEAAAVAGFGLVLLAPWRVETQVQAGLLHQVLPGWRSELQPIHALWPAAGRLPRRARLFVDMLVRRFAADPRLHP
ncbi:LysR family transcriptional regulator [Roseomonas sp. OT10]|uniref:LysR family transcriptional regulator n=1 Tax=Roseomonas cutis TaxID=2897332 RepID=UPI001E28F96E|nr:LysR family transcriptional regulator [Roseomonas sp. OT10]UFN47206.1 LysR family transcriptional regulator [Roseomonas sp. OT10]